jgi:hypothetical protein
VRAHSLLLIPQVLANDVAVSGDGRWDPCFRDNSASGHNKARSLKRALPGGGRPTVVVVGSSACDMESLEAGLTQHVYAVTGSPFARLCDDGGFRVRAFAGWGALQKELF